MDSLGLRADLPAGHRRRGVAVRDRRPLPAAGGHDLVRSHARDVGRPDGAAAAADRRRLRPAGPRGLRRAGIRVRRDGHAAADPRRRALRRRPGAAHHHRPARSAGRVRRWRHRGGRDRRTRRTCSGRRHIRTLSIDRLAGRVRSTCRGRHQAPAAVPALAGPCHAVDHVASGAAPAARIRLARRVLHRPGGVGRARTPRALAAARSPSACCWPRFRPGRQWARGRWCGSSSPAHGLG